MHNISSRLAEVRDGMEAARKSALLAAPAVTLIAVSKGQSRASAAAASGAGIHNFGENRVQEAQAKWQDRPAGIRLHLIGPLQTNKAAEAVALFDAVHTVDRARLADALKEEMEKQGKRPDLFIQVNTGREPQKAGVDPEEAEALLVYCLELGLPVIGLMCIPPRHENPAPHFALLHEMAKRMGLASLSMGMSGDFETAIRFGATHVRVGSAIFGEREL